MNRGTTRNFWNNPADIFYGTALSATQLNATANVPGTFTYTPAAGTVLNAGNGQTLHVDFVPDDAVNFTNASKDVFINVIQVTAAPTTTAIISSVNPSTFGQSVSFTATVSSSSGVPIGLVTFKDGATSLGTVTLNASGQASFSTAALSVGTHTITAAYGGSVNFATSTWGRNTDGEPSREYHDPRFLVESIGIGTGC